MEGIQNFVSGLNVYDMMQIGGMGLAGYEWQKVQGWESAFTNAPLAVAGTAGAGFGVYMAIKEGQLNVMVLAAALGAFLAGKMVSRI